MKAFARYGHMLLLGEGLGEGLDMPAHMSTGGAVLGLVAGRQSKCTEQSVCSVTTADCGCVCTQALHLQVQAPALAAKQRPVEVQILVHPGIAIDARLVSAVHPTAVPQEAAVPMMPC